MRMPGDDLQRILLVVFGHDPQHHSLLLHLQQNPLEILISQTAVLLGKLQRSMVAFPCQASPQSIVQIQQQHFFGNLPLQPHLLQNQPAQSLLSLVAQQNFPHIPHLCRESILPAHLLHHMMIGKQSHVSMGVPQPLQPLLPQLFQRRLPPCVGCHRKLRPPEIGVGDIVDSLRPQSALQLPEPSVDLLLCRLRLQIMSQHFHQIHHQKGNVRSEGMVGGGRIYHGPQLIAVSLSPADLHLLLQQPYDEIHIHIRQKGNPRPRHASLLHILAPSGGLRSCVSPA